MSELAVVSNGEIVPFDAEAEEIGTLYRSATGYLAESVKARWECGQRLLAKKESLAHGEWEPWLWKNRAALGFDAPSTATRLLKLVKKYPALTQDLKDKDAVKISREVWGHDHNHRAQGTGENEWYTPPEYIEAARKVMGAIDLDPATSEVAQHTVQAGTVLTKEDDALTKKWNGRVWLNPPYSQPEIWQFCEKLVSELTEGNVTEAILLTHNYTDTAWFHLAESIAAAICFTRGRIKFVDSSGETCAPTQGQAFFYYGENAGRFGEVFREYGFIR